MCAIKYYCLTVTANDLSTCVLHVENSATSTVVHIGDLGQVKTDLLVGTYYDVKKKKVLVNVTATGCSTDAPHCFSDVPVFTNLTFSTDVTSCQNPDDVTIPCMGMY